MTFSIVKLTGERVLVRGEDSTGTSGETVLDATEWNEVQRHRAVHKAQDAFDAEVEKFFEPLTKAAEKADAAIARPEADPISYVVIEEGENATRGTDRIVHKLGHDSIVLRLLEEGQSDRLVWVGDGLEVLETLPVPAQPVVADDTDL